MKARKEKKQLKSFETFVDRFTNRTALKVLDEDMYPFLLVDPEAGAYTITKTKNGKLEMTK